MEMKRNCRRIVALAAACFAYLFFSAYEVQAQGFRNPPEGSSAISQAGAFIAQCDDASAVTHNPAGLVQVKGQQILIGSMILHPTTSYKNGAAGDDAVPNTAFLPFIYYSTDLGNENFRLALGLSSPYGQSTEWRKSAVRDFWGINPVTGAYNVPYYSSMQTVSISPAVAYRFTPQFSAGASMDVYYSKLGVKYLVAPGVFGPVETTSKMDVDGTGYGGSFGLLYKEEKYSVGIKYKTAFDIDYDGKYSVPAVLRENAGIKIDFPHIAGVGIAVYPNPKLKIEADAEWTGYSCLKEIPVEVENLPPFPPIEKDWDDCYMFSLGTEYKTSDNVKLRCGAAYLTNPIPDSTWDPSLPGADSIVVVVGGEFSGKLGILDISLGANLFRERKIDEGGPYDGKYSSTGYFGTLAYKKSF